MVDSPRKTSNKKGRVAEIGGSCPHDDERLLLETTDQDGQSFKTAEKGHRCANCANSSLIEFVLDSAKKQRRAASQYRCRKIYVSMGS